MALLVNDINLDRQDLSAFLPDLRSIKAFENLAKAVSATIPDAVNGNTETIADLTLEVSTATVQALAALAFAQSADIAAQQALGEALQGHVMALVATVADLQTQINDLKQGYQL